MEIGIFLNGERGLIVLNSLLDTNLHSIKTIFTPTNFNTDKYKLPEGIQHLRLENVNKPESLKKLRQTNYDIFLIAGYSDIFKNEVLSIPLIATLNLHAGKLPEYRGGSPLNWQIIEGEQYAGLSVIIVDEGIDSGPILSETLIKIENSDTIETLHHKANKAFPSLVKEALEKIASKEKNFRTQDSVEARYWHQRSDKDGYLDFKNKSSLQLFNFIRAISHPYPGAWATYKNNLKVRIYSAQLSDLNLSGHAGRICCIQGQGPYLICNKGSLLITKYSIFSNNVITDEKLSNGEYLE
jgi:methionyl-tRNA formyltransferase